MVVPAAASCDVAVLDPCSLSCIHFGESVSLNYLRCVLPGEQRCLAAFQHAVLYCTVLRCVVLCRRYTAAGVLPERRQQPADTSSACMDRQRVQQ